jgi:hypothetical protein
MVKNPFSVLPGYILSSSLTDGEKIVCGIVDGFTKAYGSCEIDNATFAEMLHISQRAVEKRISRLYQKQILENRGTKDRRKLNLKYIKSEQKIPDIKEQKDDNFQIFWDMQLKKEAKAATLKYFKKLSSKNQLLAIRAYKQYRQELKNPKYAVLGRTFLKDQYYLDDKYKEEQKEETREPKDDEFQRFFKKALDVVAFCEINSAIKKLDFQKISQNEAAVFDENEVRCLRSAVTNVEGLCDQAFSEGNLKNLLRTFW